MRKRIIALVVILCVLIASVLAFVFLKDYEAPEDTGTPLPTPTPDDRELIFDFNVDDAVLLTIKKPGEEEFAIKHKVETKVVDGEEEKVDIWTYAFDEKIKLDDVECSTVFGVMSDLKGKLLDKDLIADATLEDFGLDEPTVVSVEMKDGTVYTIEVGDVTTVENGAYAKLPGDNMDIYLIGHGAALYLTSDKVEFMNTRLFSLPENKVFDSITVKDFGETRFTIESYETVKENAKDGEDDKVYNWKVTYPIDWRVNLGDVTLFVDMFESISASSVVAETKELDKYGLDKPRYEIILKLDGKEYVIKLGDTDENGTLYYGTFNDDGYVYTFSAVNFSEMDTGLNSIINQIPYEASYPDLSKFEVYLDGKNYEFNIIEADLSDKTKDVIELNGKRFTAKDNRELVDAFRTVYKGALGLWANDIDVKSKPSESAEVDIRFVFTNKVKNETVTVEYVKKDEAKYYILINGEYSGVLSNISNTNASTNDLVPGIRPAINEFMKEFNKLK